MYIREHIRELTIVVLYLIIINKLKALFKRMSIRVGHIYENLSTISEGFRSCLRADR